MRKCAVISPSGIGDGLFAMVMANNMFLNGWDVTLYHEKKFHELQSWFPNITIKKLPAPEELPSFLESYEKFFVSYVTDVPFIVKLIEEGKKKDLKVLNPCYSHSVGTQPYYKDTYFIPSMSYAENIKLFCSRILKLKRTTLLPGIECPYVLTKDEKRVVIHPTSTKKGREWGATKFVKLAKELQKMGFKPVFVVSPQEQNDWMWVEKKGIELMSFISLDKLASFIYESSYFVGNDSGIGHLSSALNLPTLTIARSKRSISLWRPVWSKGIVLSCPTLVPNIKFLRIRDKWWKLFISVEQVKESFLKLLDAVKESTKTSKKPSPESEE